MATERIGFIGVGLMGHGMAKNIVEKGYPLTVLGHRNRTPVEDLIGRGAKEAKTAREVAATSDIVFLCVTGSPQVEANVYGDNGLKAGARPGMVIVDCSTSDPTSTLKIHADLKASGITFIDAPLARTPKEAWEGTLDTMIGADDATFARVKPVCETWAGRITHIGAVGVGHQMKLLNNFIAMGYGSLYSEALALAQKVGISPQVFDSVIRGSRMDCGFYQTFMTYVLKRDRNAHRFTIRNAHKDMRYLANMASAAGTANYLGTAVKNTFAIAEGLGRGDDNVPQVSDTIAEINGVTLGPIPERDAAE
jgi:3-hydroxyisobutyrate dehydrogenase-like beta-hydroxyacid dehydrogenase